MKKSISSVCNDSSEATLIESASKSLKILIFTNLDQERKQFTKLIKTVINADIYHAIDPISAFTLYEAQVRKDRVCFMIIVCFSYTEKNLELVRNIRRIEAINEFAPSVIIGTSVNDKETELYLNAGMDDICNFNIVYPPISLHSICSIFEASYG